MLLIGQDIDLSFWERSLKRPFDPWCERIPQGGSLVLALRSRSFDQAQSADEVRGHAILLIERLNGALELCRNLGDAVIRRRSVLACW